MSSSLNIETIINVENKETMKCIANLIVMFPSPLSILGKGTYRVHARHTVSVSEGCDSDCCDGDG